MSVQMEIMRRAIPSSVPRPNRGSNRRFESPPVGTRLERFLQGQDWSFCQEHSDEAFDGKDAFFLGGKRWVLEENDEFWCVQEIDTKGVLKTR